MNFRKSQWKLQKMQIHLAFFIYIFPFADGKMLI